MTKKELIKIVAKKTNYSEQEIFFMVETTFDELKKALFVGEKISYPGFGTFSIKKKSIINTWNKKHLLQQKIDFEACSQLKSEVKFYASSN